MVTSKDEYFSDKLDIYKHLTNIKSSIGESISSDLNLAKLDDKNREFVVELVCNAFYSRDLILNTIIRAKAIGYPLNKKDEAEIKLRAEFLFSKIIRRVEMVLNTNRNVDGNYLINVLSGSNKKEELLEEKELSQSQNVVAQALGERKEDNKK